MLHSNSMEDLVMFDIIHSYSTAASIGQVLGSYGTMY